MASRERIIIELQAQAAAEGETENIRVLRAILKATVTHNEWSALTKSEWVDVDGPKGSVRRHWYLRHWVKGAMIAAHKEFDSEK